MIQELVPIGDGCSLWTEATGAGEPMVLCHGGPGLWDYLPPLAQLAGPRWRVHRYDQRGCGRSGHRGEWTLDQFIADLDTLRAHFGYQRWVAGGHSFGADLALRYALRYPHRVTAVVYICGTGLEWSTHSGAHKAAARARRSKREQARLATLAAGPRTAAQGCATSSRTYKATHPRDHPQPRSACRVQVLPSQWAIRVWSSPLSPTAQAQSAEAAATPRNSGSVPGLGVGTCVQVLPSQCKIRV